MDAHRVVLASDIIIAYDDGSLVLVKRMYDPYKDCWGLPGGMMEEGETIEQTAVREAKEETGLDVELTKLIGVYSDPYRDSRWRTVSVVYSARVTGGVMKADSDAAAIMRTKDFITMKLAFDHTKMIDDFLKSKG